MRSAFLFSVCLACASPAIAEQSLGLSSIAVTDGDQTRSFDLTLWHPGLGGTQEDVAAVNEIGHRPEDVSRAVDAILNDPTWSRHIDQDRISIVGFALGGTAALARAGGSFEPESYVQSCDAPAQGPDCALMTDFPHPVAKLDANDIADHLDDLCRVRIDSVAAGAAISFMAPLATADAQRFWGHDVRSAVEGKSRCLFGAFIDQRLAGTVQLVLGMPPNQSHRAEISKMIVHPDARRRGLATALLNEALAVAKAAGKTLVTLDTRTGDVSEPLYKGVGFIEAGVIPDFAFDPDGKAKHSTTYMYRYL